MNIKNVRAILAMSRVRTMGAALLLASLGLSACSSHDHHFNPGEGGAAGDSSGLATPEAGSPTGGTNGGGTSCPSELPECASGAGQGAQAGVGESGSPDVGDTGGAAGAAPVREPVCGDGVVDPNERCDDDNADGGDGCNSSCRIESGWNCDQGEPTHCTSICGDGLLVGAEVMAGGCDDKNQAAMDGCNGACAVEAGYVCVGTPSVCAKTCGDGKLDAGEACDDGNANAGDGCLACAVEKGFACNSASPSVCTPDPKIASFTAEYLRACGGSSLLLSANYANGSGTIDNAVGAIANGASVSSKPIAAKTTFTLTVASAGHPSATATVTVDVIPNGKFSPTGTFAGDPVTQLVPINDGRVLVVGSTANGKIYDPHSETFSPLTLPSARDYPAVTPLSAGRALVAGGIGASAVDPSGTIYDPASGMFSSTGDMKQGRYGSGAVPLANGRVLFPAGLTIMNGASMALNSIELLNLSTGQFITNSVVMKTPRWGEATALLTSGKVLFAGGCTGTSLPACPAVTNLAELYDPSSGAAGAFSDTGPMSSARLTPATAKLNGDKVLIAGGSTTTACLDSAEVFDPSAGTAGTFSDTSSMNSPRNFASATLLTNGKVLVAGGACPDGSLASAELYDPATGKFTLTGSMATDRSWHFALALANGMVLVLGGRASFGTGGTQPAPGAELYCP